MITVRRLVAFVFRTIHIGYIMTGCNHVISVIAFTNRFSVRAAAAFVAFLTGRKRDGNNNSSEENLFHEVNFKPQNIT